MVKISNGRMVIGVDGAGRMACLENCHSGVGNVIERPADDFFMINVKKGDCWENPAWGHDQKPVITAAKDRITISYPSLYVAHLKAEIDIGLEMVLSFEGDMVRFDASIDNRTEDCEVIDFEFPRIGIIKRLKKGKPALLWPVQSGMCYPDVGEYLSDMSFTREIYPNSIFTKFPGHNGSMQWMALTEGDETLYLSGHDEKYYSSVMRVQGSREDRGAITLVYDKLAFVKPGECFKCPPYVLRLYTGSWREGAQEYREWASTWRTPCEKSKWVQEMQGYFLVINKQQYGYEMWRYDQIPQLYELAKAHGCDALGLFGWYDSGHDNQYPDLEVSDSLGGAEALKENIKKVQEAGGHVTLYQQGHLIDPTTKFYKIRGHKLESKSRTGLPYYEYYCKSHKSSFLNIYTNKLFSISCPSCPEWQELMKEKTDFAASFGPDGVLFDQIGGMHPYPCFDENHPHEDGKPSLSLSGGRRALLPGIRSRAKTYGKEFAFFSEHITDIYSAFLDCVHGINSKPSEEGDRKAAAAGRKLSQGLNYPELFRYTFPETIITIRNSAPFISVRMANYAAVFGFRFEMEIRYQDDCDDILNDRWPKEREYAKKVADLRRRYWDILGYGVFTDEENIKNENPALIVKGFKKDNRLAVMLWNDTGTEEEIRLEVEGYQWKEAADTNGMRDKLPEKMKGQELLLLLFEK